MTRTFLLTSDRTYQRIIRDVILAYRLEKNLAKDEILYLYLNQVYFGNGAYGAEAAARGYFGKPASELSLAQAAMMAGLVRAPSRENPPGKLRGGEIPPALCLERHGRGRLHLCRSGPRSRGWKSCSFSPMKTQSRLCPDLCGARATDGPGAFR